MTAIAIVSFQPLNMPKEKATTRKSAKSAEKVTGGKRKKGEFSCCLFPVHLD